MFSLTVTTVAGDRVCMVTQPLIDAVSHRVTNGDIDTHIDRHGAAGLVDGAYLRGRP